VTVKVDKKEVKIKGFPRRIFYNGGDDAHEKGMNLLTLI